MPSKTIEDFAYQVRDYMRGAEVVEGKNLAYSQENNAVIATIENGKSYKVRWTGSATVTLKKNSASGTEVTSGSTSPLSFTADSDFDLYFGSSADVTEIMVYDGNDTSDTYEPYYVPVKDSMFKRSEQGVLGAKNLLPNTATSTGIFTVRSDGSVLVNGTPSGTAILAIYRGALPEGELIYSGCPKGGAFMSTYQMDILDGSNAKAYDIGEGTVISRADFTNPDDLTFRIRIAGGYQTNNMVFEPMIRLASDPDDTYQPYAMTNKEITDNLTEVKGEGTLNTTYITSGHVYWYKIGKFVLVNFDSVVVGTSIPDGSVVVSDLPVSENTMRFWLPNGTGTTTTFRQSTLLANDTVLKLSGGGADLGTGTVHTSFMYLTK